MTMPDGYLMKASEVVAKLQALIAIHGDLPVVTTKNDASRTVVKIVDPWVMSPGKNASAFVIEGKD